MQFRGFCLYYFRYGIEVNLPLVYQLLIIPVLNLLLCLVVYILAHALCSIVSVLSCMTACCWLLIAIVYL